MRTELKLHFLKKLVNFAMGFIDRMLADSTPRYPQTKMLEHMFQRLFNVYLLEVYCGRFDDVSRQSLDGLKDRNFQHFLSVARKSLLFIGENDRYYRAWIGLAFITAKEEYEKELERLSREEFQRSHLEQWELGFKCVSEGHFQEEKAQFLEMLLSAHLSNLLRMRIDFDRFSAKREK